MPPALFLALSLAGYIPGLVVFVSSAKIIWTLPVISQSRQSTTVIPSTRFVLSVEKVRGPDISITGAV